MPCKEIVLRAMSKDDLDRVLMVESAAYRFPWTRGIFEDCLAMGYPSWVAQRIDGGLVGHAVVSMAVGEAHVLNLCVDPAWQRRGIGGQLLDALLEHVRHQNAIRIFLEVRASNRAAVRLYALRGFAEVGIRKAYYPAADGREDAVVLRLDF